MSDKQVRILTITSCSRCPSVDFDYAHGHWYCRKIGIFIDVKALYTDGVFPPDCPLEVRSVENSETGIQTVGGN